MKQYYLFITKKTRIVGVSFVIQLFGGTSHAHSLTGASL